MKRLLSWLLALVMIISCLPMSVLPAFAAEEPEVKVEETTGNDDFVVDMDELTQGLESNPINLNTDLLYDGDYTATVTVAAGKTVYYTARIAGMIMSINGGEGTAMTGDNTDWPVFSITNDGAEAAEYVITVALPLGTESNPAQLIIDETNEAVIEAGNTQGYYFTWTAVEAGVLNLTVSTEAAGWTYVVNNMTSNVYGDTFTSADETVVDTANVEVAAGDKIQLMVNTFNPDDVWNNPAGTVEVWASFTYPAGSEQNPIFLSNQENTVTNEGTLYYQGYFSGMTMTVIGADSVIYNGETLTAVDGVVTTPVSSANPRMPVVVGVTGEGEIQINFAYPVGNMSNPDKLVIGENVANIEANAQGYYYTWTATEDGTLSITMPEGNWSYVINNMTSYTYGDTQWSDSDPVVNPGTVEVEAGDEIQVMVNTYDPAVWETPAGTITFTAAFEAAVTVPTVTFTTSLAAWLEIEDVIKFGVSAKISNPENYDLTDEEFVGRFKLLMWDADADAPTSAEEATIDANYDYIIDAKYNEENARFEFLIDVPAKNMGDKYVWVPCYENGDGTYTYGRFYNREGAFYAPSTYCYTQIDKSSTSQLDLDLFYAILNYCAAAQVYFANNNSGYTYDTLINADLPADKQVLNFDESAVRTSYSVDAAKEGDLARNKDVVNSRGGFLALESTIDATWYSNVNITTTSQKIYYWTEEVYLASDVLSLEDAFLCEDLTAANGRYEGAVEGRAAKQMFDLVYACMVYTDADGNQYSSGVLAFSPERYIYLNMNNTSSVGMAEMCRWMFVYGKAAQARFG